MKKHYNYYLENITFEKSFRMYVGNKQYKLIPEEQRKIIHEMSECQKKGGAIGTAIEKDLIKTED